MVHVRIGRDHLDLTWDEWERRVRDGHIPPDALVRFEPVTGAAWRPAGELEFYTSLAGSGAAAFEKAQARSGPPLLTALLVGVQIRIFWLAQVPDVRETVELRLTKWGPPIFEGGEVWRLLTMGFVHTSFTHTLVNLVWLAYTGFHLERALGRANLAVIYVASVVFGSWLSLLGRPEAPSLGASGGIFGLVAATVVFGLVKPEILPERSRRTFGFALLPYLVLMLLSGARSEGVDNWAHLGGMLAGAVLALFADPPAFERRPRWNLRWQVPVLVLLVASLVGLWATGPRTAPLWTDVEARAAAQRRQRPGADVPDPAPGPFTYAVPAGWLPSTDLAGRTAWETPLGRRTWSVGLDALGGPRTHEQVRDAWLQRAARQGWLVELGPLQTTTVAGLPGVEAVGTARRGDTADVLREALADSAAAELLVTWRAARRGPQALVEVWAVEPEAADRLEPLARRLRDATAWPLPEELRQAEAAYAREPERLDVRRRLATALLGVGEAERALQLQRAIVAEEPTSRKDRLALLRTVEMYPDIVDDDTFTALARDAVEAGLGPQVTVAVAGAAEARGQDAFARGLLLHAWLLSPGERTLARALSSRGLSTELDARGVPLVLAWDLVAGREIPADAIDRLRDLPPLDAAAILGADNADERAALVARAREQVAARDPAVIGTLALLRLGHPASHPETTLADVRHGLERAENGDPPAWWPRELDPTPFVDLLERIPDEALVPRIPTLR